MLQVYPDRRVICVFMLLFYQLFKLVCCLCIQTAALPVYSDCHVAGVLKRVCSSCCAAGGLKLLCYGCIQAVCCGCVQAVVLRVCSSCVLRVYSSCCVTGVFRLLCCGCVQGVVLRVCSSCGLRVCSSCCVAGVFNLCVAGVFKLLCCGCVQAVGCVYIQAAVLRVCSSCGLRVCAGAGVWDPGAAGDPQQHECCRQRHRATGGGPRCPAAEAAAGKHQPPLEGAVLRGVRPTEILGQVSHPVAACLL